MKPILLLLGIGLLSLTLVSCGDRKHPPEKERPPVVVQAPNYEPVAEGMKVQSYALIGVALIFAIAFMHREKNH